MGRRKTAACLRGHVRNPENTRERIDPRGYLRRECRPCDREKNRTGRPPGRPKGSLGARLEGAYFWSNVKLEDLTGCWEWQGRRDEGGYGRFGAEYREHHSRATWFSWLLAGYDQPKPGEMLCHTCDNPPCVNPWHLFIGTDLDNSSDRNAKGRTRNQVAA